MTRTFWDAHAAARITDGPPGRLNPPARMEWTQRPGIGPSAEILGSDLTGRRIVELGCGAGHNTAHLAVLGANVTGVDSCAGQIRRAEAHYRHTGAEFRHTDATTYLNQSVEPLDIIVSIFGAIGTTEPSTILAACARRLATGGILTFALPHPERTGIRPVNPHTVVTVTLPDGTTGTIPRWETDTAGWTNAVSNAGLLVTGAHHLRAPVDALWPTTLLLIAGKP